MTVFTAENGKAGIEIFREHSRTVSVIILDLKMPVMGGEETLPLLRNSTPRCPLFSRAGSRKVKPPRDSPRSSQPHFCKSRIRPDGLWPPLRQYCGAISAGEFVGVAMSDLDDEIRDLRARTEQNRLQFLRTELETCFLSLEMARFGLSSGDVEMVRNESSVAQRGVTVIQHFLSEALYKPPDIETKLMELIAALISLRSDFDALKKVTVAGGRGAGHGRRRKSFRATSASWYC